MSRAAGKMLLAAVVAAAAVGAAIAGPIPDDDGPARCGYESCPAVKEGMLNIHLVPHTHDDVGWLKTVDQYFYGSRNLIQKAGVQYILDSVIDALLHDPAKRFIYVETAFLWKWWQRQHDTRRHQVKRLVNEGRLELVGGGWSMNDEAVTHYQSTVDQMTWGMRRLNDTFGACGRPRVAWQIDPFGHARDTASVFAQLGFDGLFIARLDYQDKQQRLTSKTAEMVWRASANLGKSAELFTSILYNHYQPPPGFCFDVLCADEPIIDDKRSPMNNVEKRVNDFLEFAANQSKYYTSGHIVMTMGGDFTYQQANMWFANLDKIIRYVNARQSNGSKVNVLYSTPSCYLKAVNDQKLTWTTKSDDFFPYASDSHAYWTGYYSSRPTLKYFERLGNNALQVCKQLYSLADLGPEDWVDLNALREAMGVMQHHDAITGTEQEHVAKDYARILSNGLYECDIIAQSAVNKLLAKKERIEEKKTPEDAPLPKWETCLQLNISECAITEQSKAFVVTVYNPLARPGSHYIRFPVTGSAYKVEDSKGQAVPAQLIPLPEPLLHLPGRMSEAKQDLVFRAENLPPLGMRSYFVTRTSAAKASSSPSTQEENFSTIGHKDHFHTISSRTGSLKTLNTRGVKIQLQQTIAFYEGAIGNNMEALNRSSGAYIFRPNGTTPKIISGQRKVKKYTGPLVEEVHEELNEWVSQVVRVYTKEAHTEVEWLVGPIPIEDGVGKEVVVLYKSDLATGGAFFTDSNGREVLARRRGQRPTWRLHLQEPVAGNYYPVTSRLLLRDRAAGVELAALTDRAQGGASLADGHMQLMVHRRLLHDDAFGVAEALNETAFGRGLVARGIHFLVAGSLRGGGGDAPSVAAQERLLAQEKLLRPWLLFADAQGHTRDSWAREYRMEAAGLRRALPPNVHLLTLEPWKGRSLLLRLEHIMEQGDDPTLSKPATVSLKELFAPFEVTGVREATLGANQWLRDSHRLQWRSESNAVNERPDAGPRRAAAAAEDILSVTLTPMQIRTFVVDVKFA